MSFKNGDKNPIQEEVNQNAKLGEVMVEELAEVQHMTNASNYEASFVKQKLLYE